MKKKVVSGRLIYEPDFGYSDGVLVHPNWYEERQKYINTTHAHTSLYRTDFIDTERNFTNPNMYWNNKIPGEGFDPRLVMDHEGDKYHENYSTTTGLAYRPNPKLNRVYNTTFHRFMPEQDFTLNYGNTKQWGLKERKRKQWEFEINAAASTWHTESTDNFKQHDPKDYCTFRHSPLKTISTKLYELNNNYSNMNLRGKQLLIERDFPYKLIPRPYPHFYF